LVQKKILDAAIRAPSGGNTQGWRFMLVDDPAVKAKLGPLYRSCMDTVWNSFYKSRRDAADAAPKAPESIEFMKMYRSADHLAQHFEEVPLMLFAFCQFDTSGGSIFPAVWNAMHGAQRDCEQATIADGIAVKSPGALTLPIIRQQVKDVLLVGEDDIEQAILLLLEIEKTVVEGAGAVGLAALRKHKDRFAGRHVGLVLCGGNIEPLVLAEIIQRGLVKSGRLVRLRFDVRDVPGALADVAAALGRLGANIDQVQHQRAFTTLSVERAQIEVVVQTRGMAHVGDILEVLRTQGYRVERIE